MKRNHTAGALVIIAGLLIVAIGSGCLLRRGPETPATEATAPPEALETTPSTPATPQSPATLGEAAAGFSRPSSFEMTVSDDDEPQSLLMKMDGKKVIAYKIMHPDGSLLVDVAQGVSYTYDAEANEAYKMRLEDDDEVPNPYEMEDPSLKISGSELVGDVDCWVVEGEEEGGARVKMWIGKTDGLLRRETDGEEVINYKYARIGEIPDSEFAVPEGARIVDLTDMEEVPGDEGQAAPHSSGTE